MPRIKRFLGTVSAVGILVSGALASSGAAPAHAQSGYACIVQGSGSITPGLTPVPQAESMGFNGSMSCLGVIGGTVFTPGNPLGFVGSATGCTEGIEGGLCLDVSLVAGPISCSGGLLVGAGTYSEIHCKTPLGFFWMYWLMIPNPINQGTDIQTVNFEGYSDGVDA